jgi:hypothetical protein
MLTIGELVTLDEEAEFRNDVQLDAYDHAERNLSLLRSYLFTGSAPSDAGAAVRSISSVGVLDQIRQAFLNEKLDNRLAVIANYGHGKSHLALALANYFGKPVDSKEVQLLFTKIDNAVNDPARASGYHDFKRSRGEFLVVRLRGDMPRTLHEQFMAGLEKALSEHTATVGQRPQFWHSVAERFLSGLTGNARERADAFLEQYSTEVSLLLREVQQRHDVYDICVRLFTHLYGVPPNFGGETSLKEVINWAANTFCGVDKPLGGMLILFDEFSAYINKYAQRNATGELQDLLNGVDDQRGKVVFLAFAQHDPLTVAEQVHLPGQSRESLKRELTRLTRKFALYSLMESVIDAYLKQSDDAWQRFTAEAKVKGHLYQATDFTHELFKARYDRELHWTIEKFQEAVTKGCFPLHPLTTALLCNLRFNTAEDIGVPRTVLGFVMEQLNRRQHLPAVEMNRINWVLPVTLVDYFGARLHGDHYTAYKNAARLLDLAAPAHYEQVLKTLLLQEVANIRVRGERQVELLAQCVGLTEDETKQALKSLSESRCIRYDPINRVNSFWALSTNPDELEKILAGKLADLPFDEAALKKLESLLKTELQGGFGAINIRVAWGDASDWAAYETITTLEHLSNEYFLNLAQRYEAAVTGLVEGRRGCLVWLVARNEDEVAWYRQQVTALMDKALPGDAPMPVVCMLPSEPHPEIIEAFQRIRGLEKFSQNEREAVGTEFYTDEIAKAKVALLRACSRLRGEAGNCLDVPRPTGAYAVPVAYRARIVRSASITGVLTECYKLAYRFVPPEFFTQYKANKTSLRDAVKLIAGLLLQNSPRSLRDGVRTNPVARDLCEKFLIQRWGLINSDYRIQEPNSMAIQHVWEHLDTVCPPGSQETAVDELLMPLFNPPFGYDYNTATLVFCAWFGFNHHDLQVSTFGRRINRERLGDWLSKGPKDFINELCCNQMVALARRDPGEIVQEVKVILEKIKAGSFTQAEAESAIAKLEEVGRDERNSVELRDKVQAGAMSLREALAEAKNYDQQANKLIQAIKAENNLRTLLDIQRKIASLPRTSLVSANAPTPVQLREQVQGRLAEVVEIDCERLEKLERLTQFENNQGQLSARKKMVQDAGYSPLVERFDVALRKLEEKRIALEKENQEEAIRVEIQGMDENARLKSLYNYRTRLEAVNGYSAKTMDLRNARLQRISKAIEQLESQVDTWQTQIETVASVKALDGLRDALLRQADRYQETVYAPKLEAAQKRMNDLREFLGELEEIRKAIQSNAFASPAEAERQLQTLAALAEKFGAIAAPKQRAMVEELQQTIAQHVQEKRSQALEWLRRLEEEHRTSQSPVRIKEKLAHPPAFLPAEARSDLQRLSEQVQMRIDQDAVARIELEFRQIVDRKQREECLRRLELVMQES